MYISYYSEQQRSSVIAFCVKIHFISRFQLHCHSKHKLECTDIKEHKGTGNVSGLFPFTFKVIKLTCSRWSCNLGTEFTYKMCTTYFFHHIVLLPVINKIKLPDSYKLL